VSQRPDSGLLAGFWEFTCSDCEENEENSKEMTYKARQEVADAFLGLHFNKPLLAAVR